MATPDTAVTATAPAQQLMEVLIPFLLLRDRERKQNLPEKATIKRIYMIFLMMRK